MDELSARKKETNSEAETQPAGLQGREGMTNKTPPASLLSLSAQEHTPGCHPSLGLLEAGGCVRFSEPPEISAAGRKD